MTVERLPSPSEWPGAFPALDAAFVQAEKSWSEGGIPIGSCLVDLQGNIVARGHNMRVQSGDPTAHAETVCIRNAGRRRDFGRLLLVSTLSPCSMCTGTALLYKIERVLVGENQSFLGAEDWLLRHGVVFHVVDDPRCKALMQRLFGARMDLWREDIGE